MNVPEPRGSRERKEGSRREQRGGSTHQSNYTPDTCTLNTGGSRREGAGSVRQGAGGKEWAGREQVEAGGGSTHQSNYNPPPDTCMCLNMVHPNTSLSLGSEIEYTLLYNRV